MSALETLKKARDLISDPAKWTQGNLASDVYGDEIDPQSDDAICFCAIGAIERFTGTTENTEADLCLSVTCEKLSGLPVFAFNDSHTHPEVVALFDAAIAELEQAQ
jgi:hypothetical protein